MATSTDSSNPSVDKKVVIDFSPFFKLYDDHTIDRFQPLTTVPLRNDAVSFKDVTVDSETNLSVRIFAPPESQSPGGAIKKLPLLFYVHGGAFCVGSAKHPVFHNFISTLVGKSQFIAVSVDYRLAPEHRLPIAFDDSWAAFEFVASHAGGGGTEPLIRDRVDFTRVFFGGESAGACIANDVAVRAGARSFPNLNVVGTFLAHPFFGGKEVDGLYKFLCPESSGRDDDPRLNPALDPRIGTMAGRRVLFMVGEKDFLKSRALSYCDGLRKSAWVGDVEVYETLGEGHCFYLYDLKKEKALAFMDRLVEFLTRQ